MDDKQLPERTGGNEDLVEKTHLQLLDMLLTQGALASTSLSVAALAKSLGVSRTPVNLALVRLQCEGLVKRTTDSGWATAQLELDDVVEIFEIRETLDILVARRAAEHVTPEGAAELLNAVGEMERAAETKDFDRWRVADRQFHKGLWSLVGNNRLKQVLEKLDHQLSRLNVTNVVLTDEMVVSSREHRTIAEAISSGDPELAANNALHHTTRLKSSLLNMMNNVVEPLRGMQL